LLGGLKQFAKQIAKQIPEQISEQTALQITNKLPTKPRYKLRTNCRPNHATNYEQITDKPKLSSRALFLREGSAFFLVFSAGAPPAGVACGLFS
jgi:hypothetical protein